MRIFILSMLLAACSSAVDSESNPATSGQGGEAPGGLDEPTEEDAVLAAGASEHVGAPSGWTESILPDLDRERMPEKAIDDLARIRDSTGAVPPPYVIHSAWEKRRLTYCLVQGTSDLTEAELIEAIEAAAWVWMEESNIVLTRVQDCWSGTPNIMIAFLSPDHDRYDAIYGSADAADSLGEAELPHEDYTLYLYMRDDDTVEWTTDYRYDLFSPFDVRTVLTHEFGHLLGLSHTDADCTESLYPMMCPIYLRSRHTLHSDDIDGISSIYGSSMGYCVDGFTAIQMGYTFMGEAMEAAESLNALDGDMSTVSTMYTRAEDAWRETEKSYSYAQQTVITGPVHSGSAASYAYTASGYADSLADAAYTAFSSTYSADAMTTEYRAKDTKATLQVAFDLMYQCYADEYGDDTDF
jgi:hypothetical protein